MRTERQAARKPGRDGVKDMDGPLRFPDNDVFDEVAGARNDLGPVSGIGPNQVARPEFRYQQARLGRYPLQKETLHYLTPDQGSKLRTHDHPPEARPGQSPRQIARVYRREPVSLAPERQHRPGPNDHPIVKTARQVDPKKRKREIRRRVHVTPDQVAARRHQFGIKPAERDDAQVGGDRPGDTASMQPGTVQNQRRCVRARVRNDRHSPLRWVRPESPDLRPVLDPGPAFLRLTEQRSHEPWSIEARALRRVQCLDPGRMRLDAPDLVLRDEPTFNPVGPG